MSCPLLITIFLQDKDSIEGSVPQSRIFSISNLQQGSYVIMKE